MSRLIITAVVIVVAVTIFAVVDCAMTEAKRTRALTKPVWVVVVLLVPVVGPLLWLFFGKVRGDGAAATKPTPATPDDDEAFLKSIGIESDSEERIRKLEEELKALDDEFPTTAHKDPSVAGGTSTALEDGPAPDDATAPPKKSDRGGKRPRKADAGEQAGADQDDQTVEHTDDHTQGDGSSRA